MNITSFIDDLKRRGIRLEATGNGNIKFSGPLTAELRGAILERKPALLIALALEARVRDMAKRWGYTAAELAETLADATRDPARMAAWIQHDEQHFGHCTTAADFATAYRAMHGLH